MTPNGNIHRAAAGDWPCRKRTVGGFGAMFCYALSPFGMLTVETAEWTWRRFPKYTSTLNSMQTQIRVIANRTFGSKSLAGSDFVPLGIGIMQAKMTGKMNVAPNSMIEREKVRTFFGVEETNAAARNIAAHPIVGGRYRKNSSSRLACVETSPVSSSRGTSRTMGTSAPTVVRSRFLPDAVHFIRSAPFVLPFCVHSCVT
jgi:hypothetical protein